MVTDIADFLTTSPDKTVSEGPGKQIYVSAFIMLEEMCKRERLCPIGDFSDEDRHGSVSPDRVEHRTH